MMAGHQRRSAHEDAHRGRLGRRVQRQEPRGLRARQRRGRGRQDPPRGRAVRRRRRRHDLRPRQARFPGVHQHPRAHGGRRRRLPAARQGEERLSHGQLYELRRTAEGQDASAAGGRGGRPPRLRVPARAEERDDDRHRRGRPARRLGGIRPPRRRPRRARLREPAVSRPRDVHGRPGPPHLRGGRRRRPGAPARGGGLRAQVRRLAALPVRRRPARPRAERRHRRPLPVQVREDGHDAAIVPALPRGRRQPRDRHRHLPDGHRRRAALGLDPGQGHRRQLSGRAAARRLQRGDARRMQVPGADRSRPPGTRREGRPPADQPRPPRGARLRRPDQGPRRRRLGSRRGHRHGRRGHRHGRRQGPRAGRPHDTRERGRGLREGAAGDRAVLESRGRLALGRRDGRSHRAAGLPDEEAIMTLRAFRLSVAMLLVTALGALVAPPPRAAAQGDQVTWGVHINLAPTWLDPAEASGIITPYMIYYALHDALAKPMPGQLPAPSLAESWTVSKDHLTHEFVLRSGVRFHNGEPLTAEDVKFSFERYRGAAAKTLKERVAAVEVVDPGRVRFRLRQPWPDFLTFYTTATGAGWIVPKKYVDKVGDDGFKKAPVGAGPYKFVSFTPGVEIVMEAFDQYWRKRPNVRRLVFKVIPDESTRLAALKRGEVDIVYSIRGALAEELRRTPGVQLKATVLQGTFWVYFPEQWDPKSPWHNLKVRQAVNVAFDRQAINQAETLGYSRITYNIVPDIFEFFWKPPAVAYDPAKAKQLLAEAGYPNGFDAGEYFCDVAYANIAEAVQNYLHAVGVRTKLRPLERAAFFSGYGEKKFKNIIQGASGAFGNAATRLEAFVAAGGTYVYGSYPDIDGPFREQAAELDPKRREAMLHRIQQLVHERVIYAPIWQLAFLNGVGPRIEESSLGAIPGFAYSGPYEDVRLKK